MPCLFQKSTIPHPHTVVRTLTYINLQIGMEV